MRKSKLHLSTVAGSGLILAAALAPTQAFAWGHTGHVMISRLAIEALPAEVPAFLRTTATAQEIGELGAEADVSKSTGDATTGTYPNVRSAGTVHDFERDPGHYIDFDDKGFVQGGAVSITALPSSRRDFDTAQRTVNDNQYSAGYLSYNLIDHWQQIRKDFAYIRAFTKAIQTATTPADRSFFQYQLQLRQRLTIRDIGYWSHFVADASQPLHVSIHFNGWGNYPNPNNYTTAPIHAPLEGAFVKAYVTPAAVKAQIAPRRDCDCAIEQRTVQYLQQTLAQVEPLYQVGSADQFRNPTQPQVDFITKRVAAGAAEMRDLIVDAWRSSTKITVGYPLIKVTDIESGEIMLTPDRFAGD